MFKKIVLLGLLFWPALHLQAKAPSTLAQQTANYAVKAYQNDMVTSLSKLVQFNTVAVEGIKAIDNPAHIAFKAELKNQATALGLDYTDHGYVAVIGLGNSKERVGIITHGDVQPVNISKWKKSPFELDTTSEPGKLIARGTEDDKGPISSALYAMKAIKDQKIALNKRLELYVYMAEESDWQPLKDFVKNNSLPQINITLDSEYPVVNAEKGYGTISVTFAKAQVMSEHAYISSFTGGAFGSQIPEDAKVVIKNSNYSLLEKLIKRMRNASKVTFDINMVDDEITITALGKSAHSSKPEQGVNAITHIADLLSFQQWPNNAGGALVNFINDNLGTNLYGENFGDIAYQDDFMGKMTVSATVLKQVKNGIELNINIRRPQGKSQGVLSDEIKQAIAKWQTENKVALYDQSNSIGDPWLLTDAPHIDTLLSVFSHFSGIENAKPIAIGGGTNSRLFPNAVSFGPSMPNTSYTGHSEHEYITMEQFVLNLKMYTAVLVELAK